MHTTHHVDGEGAAFVLIEQRFAHLHQAQAGAQCRVQRRKLGCDAEYLFVDDGSTDRTVAVLRELHARSPRVNIISFRRNYGKSAALSAGFREVDGDYVVTIDADLQDDPAEIPNLLRRIDAGADLVARSDDRVRSRPHLTVGRVDPSLRRSRSRWTRQAQGEDPADVLVRALAVYAGPSWLVEDVQLLASQPGAGRGGGPLYTPVRTYRLSAA